MFFVFSVVKTRKKGQNENDKVHWSLNVAPEGCMKFRLFWKNNKKRYPSRQSLEGYNIYIIHERKNNGSATLVKNGIKHLPIDTGNNISHRLLCIQINAKQH